MNISLIPWEKKTKKIGVSKNVKIMTMKTSITFFETYAL